MHAANPHMHITFHYTPYLLTVWRANFITVNFVGRKAMKLNKMKNYKGSSLKKNKIFATFILSGIIVGVVCYSTYTNLSNPPYIEQDFVDYDFFAEIAENHTTLENNTTDEINPLTQAAKPKPPVYETEFEPEATSVSSVSTDIPVDDTPPEFVFPVNGTVSLGFSDTLPVFSKTMNDWRIHKGIDINSAEGTPVKAVADGRVTKIYDDPLLGKVVEITHKAGFVSRYTNLQMAVSVVEDAEVQRGDIIGGIGNTAELERVMPAHIHFELYKDGVAVDPLEYIK